MKLSQLQYFVEISSCGSITKAAEKLFISQPALTHAIQDLETEFGTTLLIRRKTGIDLTNEGKILLKEAKKVLKAADELTDTMTSVTHGSKTLKIGISIFTAKMYPSLINDYMKTHPHISIKGYAFGSAELRKYVESEDLDVAVSGALPKNNPELNNIFTTKTLLSSESFFWTNINNPLSKKEIIDINTDIDGTRIAQFRESSIDTFEKQTTNIIPEKAGAKINFSTNQLGEIKDLLLENRASTFLPRGIFSNCPTLVSVPTKQHPSFCLAAFWKKDKAYTHILDFVDFAEEYIKNN